MSAQDAEVKEILSSVDDTELDEDDLFDIVEALDPVKARWQEIGMGLRLKLGDVEAIKANHDPPSANLQEVLKLFLRKNYSTKKFGLPTWRRLVEVVGIHAAGQRPDLARKIAKDHPLEGSVPSSQSATAAAIPAAATKPTAAVFAAKPTLAQLQRLKYIDASGEKKDIRISTAAASKWWDIGVALKYSSDVLSIIKDSEQMNPKRCLNQLIHQWFQNGKKISWEAFLEALEDAELDELAENIRKALPTMITD